MVLCFLPTMMMMLLLLLLVVYSSIELDGIWEEALKP
jgi:hypothetical protein